jgi:hypothetical protein
MQTDKRDRRRNSRVQSSRRARGSLQRLDTTHPLLMRGIWSPSPADCHRLQPPRHHQTPLALLHDLRRFTLRLSGLSQDGRRGSSSTQKQLPSCLSLDNSPVDSPVQPIRNPTYAPCFFLGRGTKKPPLHNTHTREDAMQPAHPVPSSADATSSLGNSPFEECRAGGAQVSKHKTSQAKGGDTIACQEMAFIYYSERKLLTGFPRATKKVI